MTLSTTQDVSSRLPSHNTEAQLFTWMDDLCTNSYQQAQQAVNDWWGNMIVALAAADQFYGYDTTAGKTNSKMPEKLVEWCHLHGLKTASAISKARAVSRAWLMSSYDAVELVEEIGYSKLQLIGKGGQFKGPQLLDAAIEGASRPELDRLSKELETDPDVLAKRLEEAESKVNQRIEANDHKGADNAKRSVKKIEEKIASLHSPVAIEDQTSKVELLTRKLVAAELEANQAREIAEQAQQETDAAIKATEAARKAKKLIESELRESEEKRRQADPFGNLSPMIRSGGIQHCITQYEGSATELKELRLAAPGSSTEDIEVMAVDAMTAWVHVLSPSMLQELNAVINSKQQKQTVHTTQTINVTPA